MHKDGSALSELEKKVTSALATIEGAHAALKDGMAGLTLTNAREVEAEGRKAVALFVPVPQLSKWRRIAKQVIEELEKRLDGAHVVIIASRTMVRLQHQLAPPMHGRSSPS